MAYKLLSDHCEHVRLHNVRTTPPVRATEEKERDDEQFLRRRISFFTEEEMVDLEPGLLLGMGGHGSVRRVLYRGETAVVKELKDSSALLPLLREARFMVELDGAGGVPRVLAVCLSKAATVQEFVGKTYDKFLHKCSVSDLLDSLVSISRCLGEMHDKGIVHNDLKMDNITFSGGVREPLFHLIDLGWSCRVGRVACDFTAEDDDDGCGEEDYRLEEIEEDPECPWRWMAPEVRARLPVYPAGDVYSFGFLLQYLVQSCKQGFLTKPLWRLAERCTIRNPRSRPSLTYVAEAITGLREELVPHQLHEDFNFVEE